MLLVSLFFFKKNPIDECEGGFFFNSAHSLRFFFFFAWRLLLDRHFDLQNAIYVGTFLLKKNQIVVKIRSKRACDVFKILCSVDDLFVRWFGEWEFVFVFLFFFVIFCFATLRRRDNFGCLLFH